MLGTNDIIHNPTFMDQREYIIEGYLELARQLKSISSRPTLYVMIPPPIL